MQLYYISPSTIPSRSANSIHVVNMCEGFVRAGCRVTLFVHSDKQDSHECELQLKEYYGIGNDNIKIIASAAKLQRGKELLLGILALSLFLKEHLLFSRPIIIVSRNLYGAFFLGNLCGQNVIYETHAPDKGFRKILQKAVIRRKKNTTVVISNALREVIASTHSAPSEILYVLHDAARDGCGPMKKEEKIKQRHCLLDGKVDLSIYDKVVGYFGQLYPGRGVEIISEVARENPKFVFIIYGRNEIDIIKHRKNNTIPNLFFLGHLPPGKVRLAMAMMDILLMPYQRSVSVGLKGVNTAQWMSPMKLFEYMSVGVPIVASDLPVLHEVLEDHSNCLFVPPDKPDKWSDALRELANNSSLALSIAETAYQQFKQKYTWTNRARQMLRIAEDVV